MYLYQICYYYNNYYYFDIKYSEHQQLTIDYDLLNIYGIKLSKIYLVSLILHPLILFLKGATDFISKLLFYTGYEQNNLCLHSLSKLKVSLWFDN